MTEKKGPETWQEINPGCMVFRRGSAADYHTGSWRAKKPLWENEKCIKCGVCWVYCPDSAIIQLEDRYFTANLNYCKGCGICAHECPVACISMHTEEEL